MPLHQQIIDSFLGPYYKLHRSQTLLEAQFVGEDILII